MTVSRVLHGQNGVRETTRIRVQRIIDELGYVPDNAAQSLSRRRKEIIGLALAKPEIEWLDLKSMASRLYHDEVLNGVEHQLWQQGWSLLVTFAPTSVTADQALRRLQTLSGRVDGLLIGHGFAPAGLLGRFAARIPVVVIGGTRGQQAFGVAAADDFSGSAALITHLVVDHGLRHLFHVDGPADSPDAAERRRALEHVLSTHPRCRLVGSAPGNFSAASGQRAGERLLARRLGGGLPQAVICANDQMAIGVITALEVAGVRVPDDIAVVGFDDSYSVPPPDPPLTTVHQPMRALGERACRQVLDRIADPGLAPRLDLLPTHLVLRSSCGCPPGPPSCGPSRR